MSVQRLGLRSRSVISKLGIPHKDQVECSRFSKGTGKTSSLHITTVCVLHAAMEPESTNWYGRSVVYCSRDTLPALLGRRWSEGSKDLYGGHKGSGRQSVAMRFREPDSREARPSCVLAK